MSKAIYLDHHATTPVDLEVFEAMKPYFCEDFGNAASKHHCFGWKPEAALEHARKKVSEFFSCSPEEVIFTAGATEGNHLSVLGSLRYMGAWNSGADRKKIHLMTSQTEHHSVLDLYEDLEKQGFSVTFLKPDSTGVVSAEEVRKNIRPGETKICSLMFANNEIGTIHPIAEIAKVLKSHEVLFHVDACQGTSYLEMSFQDLGCDFLTTSGHKMYAPKGVGVLLKKNSIPMTPLFLGGKQESGRRAGTSAIPLIVGFGKACEVTLKNRKNDHDVVSRLRDQFQNVLLEKIPGSKVLGNVESRLPNNLSFYFPNVQANAMLGDWKNELAASSGSACQTSDPKPSHVLTAIGLSKEECQSVVRFGFGKKNTEEEIKRALETVLKAYEKNKF